MADRTNGRLEAAALAYRTEPSEENRAVLMATQEERVEDFNAEQATEFIERTTEAPPSQAITAGTRVLVAEEKGRWIVKGANKDGSLTCYPATGGGARSFRPEWCAATTRTGRGGKPVKVTTVPPIARRARATWRDQHGFGQPVGGPASPVGIGL